MEYIFVDPLHRTAIHWVLSFSFSILFSSPAVTDLPLSFFLCMKRVVCLPLPCDLTSPSHFPTSWHKMSEWRWILILRGNRRISFGLFVSYITIHNFLPKSASTMRYFIYLSPVLIRNSTVAPATTFSCISLFVSIQTNTIDTSLSLPKSLSFPLSNLCLCWFFATLFPLCFDRCELSSMIITATILLNSHWHRWPWNMPRARRRRSRSYHCCEYSPFFSFCTVGYEVSTVSLILLSFRRLTVLPIVSIPIYLCLPRAARIVRRQLSTKFLYCWIWWCEEQTPIQVFTPKKVANQQC